AGRGNANGAAGRQMAGLRLGCDTARRTQPDGPARSAGPAAGHGQGQTADDRRRHGEGQGRQLHGGSAEVGRRSDQRRAVCPRRHRARGAASMITSLSAEAASEIAALRGSYGEKAIRVQYGETMVALAAENPDFLVLTADLMYATGMERFGALYP